MILRLSKTIVPTTILTFLILLPGLCVSALPTDSMVVQSEKLYKKGSYQQAINLLLQGLKTKNNPQIDIKIHNSLGNAYTQLGKPVEALSYYQNAIKIAEQTNHKAFIGEIEKNIGALYEEQHKFELALIHYKKAGVFAKQFNNEVLLADILNNTGVIYEQQLNYTLALNTYQKALKLYTKLQQTDRIALTLNNIGIVYKYLKNYPKALSFYNQSLTLSKKLADQFFIAANLNNIGNVYAMMKDYTTAIAYNKQSLSIATRIGATNIIVEALGSLAEDYAGKGDYKLAYEWNQKFITAKSDYINLETTNKLAELQTKYETEKKDLQIEDLSQSKQIDSLKLKTQDLIIQRRNYQIALLLILLVCGFFGAYILYRIKRNKQKAAYAKAIKQVQSEERSRIAQDMHDDIGSGLSKITLIAGVATKRLSQHSLETSEISNITQISKDLVENMRDLIWVLNPENATLDNLVVRIREYCFDYLEACNIPSEILVQDDIPCLQISQQVQKNIFLTVKEALHNCVKHSGCNHTRFTLTYNNNELAIVFTDNGKGFKAEALHFKGNGLCNMRRRIESVGGIFETSSQMGAGTTIKIKIKEEHLKSAVPYNTIKV